MLKPLQLLTPRLVLRPARARDAQALQAAWPDADVPRWFTPAPSPTAGLWLIALLRGAHDVGCVALRSSTLSPLLGNSNSNALNPLVALWPAHRGRGYAQEALKAVLWHAQSASAGRSFVAVCDVPNNPGDRLLRRLGFVPGYEADGGRSRVRQYQRT